MEKKRVGDKNTTVHRKPNGAAYLYSIESYWDKELKQPRNRQVCIGRIDEATGEAISSGRKRRAGKEAGPPGPGIAATTKVYGPFVLLDKLAADTGLKAVLRMSFPDIHKEILSLAFFIAQKGLALSHCDIWSASHMHPADINLCSQRVSELLKLITEDGRQHFLSLWLTRLSESELLCYDITSISSYATANEYVRRGHNRDNENLPQVNLAMLFGQGSGMPAYYRRMPGNISDVVTLRNTIDTLDFLGRTKLNFVLDRGFYSKNNVDALLSGRHHFALAVPTGRVWVRDIIDLYHETITSPGHYRETGDDEALYMASHLFKWGDRRTYLHLYYNMARAAEDFGKLNKKLVKCKAELESDNLDEANRELYERFFIVKRTPKRGLSVRYNDQEIQKYRKRYAGFFCVLTNVKIDSGELLGNYRRKDVVENCFDDLKNILDMKRLRVHTSAAMDSRLFIQFIALILISRIRMIAAEAKEVKKVRYLTVRDIMEAMECIVRITYAGRYGSIISELAPLQRDIVKAFELELET